MQQTQTIDNLFLDPEADPRPRPVDTFLLRDDDIFTVADLKLMENMGLSLFLLK